MKIMHRSLIDLQLLNVLTSSSSLNYFHELNYKCKLAIFLCYGTGKNIISVQTAGISQI